MIRETSTTLPLYAQIAEDLREQIEGGQLLPGSQLSSERHLSEQLGVNRMTLRKALRRLETQGLLVRQQGAGTFVAEPKIEQWIGQWLPFPKENKKSKTETTAKILSFRRQTAEIAVARELQLNPSDEVYQINRLRFVNEEPVILERLIMPAFLFPKFEQYDAGSRLVYDIMETEYQISVSRVRQTLESGAATEFEANLLNMATGDHLLIEHRLAFDEQDRPIELGKDYYRGDRFRFITEFSPKSVNHNN